MTASRIPSEPTSLVSPVIDYEPPPVGVTPCPPPTPAALRRRTARPLRLISHAPVREPVPPRTAVVFADTALRRVLEVIDRRRPVAQLRPLLAPALIDTVIALTRSSHTAAATLRRVRVRMVDGVDSGAPHVRVDSGAPHVRVDSGVRSQEAEVFGTYTRGPRVRAIAARIAVNGDRWRIVALQIG